MNVRGAERLFPLRHRQGMRNCRENLPIEIEMCRSPMKPAIMKQTILPANQLRALLQAFLTQRGEEYYLHALGYFGSYARNEATPESDVDIVFQTDAPNLFRAARMREELVDVLHRPVDVVRLRESMNPRMKARIEKEAVYV
uniref:Predicted nucleotidyltransferase n=1 Tax=Candidatus Kentrum sp. UNK TaxID=2126344 RepID=A0A451AZY1_9GAMM|nr:MAG: Predicted nucleotidyltransferase [Candidatus Kentron sp. UNK]VFK71581.1 MAG: Predicted nucleotidyltransferase [Candidatus Kentron sp. UNK]